MNLSGRGVCESNTILIGSEACPNKLFFLSFRNFTTKMWMLKILTVPEIKNVTITSPNLPSKQVPTIDPNFSIFAFCVALTYLSWRTGFLEQI